MSVALALWSLLLFLGLAVVCVVVAEAVATVYGWRAKTFEDALRNLVGDEHVKSGLRSWLGRVDSPADPKPAHVAAGEGNVVTSLWNHWRLKALVRDPTSRMRRRARPSQIPPKAFSLALAETIAAGAPESELTGELPCEQTDDVILQRVRQAANELPEGQLRDVVQKAAQNAHSTLDGFRAQVEHLFDDSMQRASGWYRRKVQILILVVASVLVVGLNVDAIQVAEAVWTDASRASDLVLRTAPNADAAAEELRSLGRTTIPIGWGDAPRDAFSVMLIGWLITISALTFAAPLLFDLASRFSRFRVASVAVAPSGRDDAAGTYPITRWAPAVGTATPASSDPPATPPPSGAAGESPGGTPPSPPARTAEADEGGSRGFYWDVALKVVGAAGALAVWIAIAGGGRVWARLDSANLPTTQTLAAIPQHQLVVEGLQTIFVPCLIGGIVALLVYAFGRNYERSHAQDGTAPVASRNALGEARARFGPTPLVATIGVAVLGLAVAIYVIEVNGYLLFVPLIAGACAAAYLAAKGARGPAVSALAAGGALGVVLSLFFKVGPGATVAMAVITVLAALGTLTALATNRSIGVVAATLFASVAVWAAALGYVKEQAAEPEFDRLTVALKSGSEPPAVLLAWTDKQLLAARGTQVDVLDRAEVVAFAYGGSAKLGDLGTGPDKQPKPPGGGPKTPPTNTTPRPGPVPIMDVGITPKAAEQREQAIESYTSTVDGELVRIDVVTAERLSHLVVVNLRVINLAKDGAKPLVIGSLFDDGVPDRRGRVDTVDGITLVDGENELRHLAARDEKHRCLCDDALARASVPPGTFVALSTFFKAPPAGVETVQLDIPHFGSEDVQLGK